MALLAVTVALFVVPVQRAYAADCPTGLAQGSDGCCPQSSLDANKGTSNEGRCCPPNQQPDSSGACQTSSDATLDCGAGAASWVVCFGIQILQGAAQQVDSLIMNQLSVNTQDIFNTNCSGGSSSCNTTNAQAYYAAWNSFRIIGTGIIVIAGLIMIVAQATGFEAVDAYTIRKVLPRLGIAIIGIQLSWPLMQIVINLFNVLGYDLRQIMYAPFASLPKTAGGGSVSEYILGNPLTLIVAGGTLWAIYGPAIFTFLLTGFLAAILALAVLVIRQIGIIVLVIMAPVAIACYVLPGTQKVWKLWTDNFLGLLMMFPIISMLIAAGHILSAVARTGNTFEQIVSIIAYFIPYFLLPLAFKMATGFIGNISGMINDRGKGAFDRLRNVRQKRAEENIGAIKQGFNRTRLGSALQAGRHRSVARRAAWGAGAVGTGGLGTRRYRSELENAEFGHLAASAAESIKNNPSAAANDDANAIAQYATSRRNFITRYMRDAHNGAGATREEAMSQLAYTEQAYGEIMGSKQMQHTSATAALASNSSTDSVAERAAWMRNAVSNHVMTDSQAASLVKQSGSLASSAGFGDLLGAANGTLSDADLLTRATTGFNPANSHRMRKGQAQEMAKEVHRQAAEAASTYGVNSVQFAKAIADGAGMHDVMNGMTPDVREEFANYLNGASVGGKRIREHEADLETGTGLAHEEYLNRRKTWSSTAAGASGGAPGGVPGAGGGGGAPAGSAGGGAGGGGIPSDIRLKRDIFRLTISETGIQLYRFKYKWSDQEYVGVMAQDLAKTHPEALSKDELGYYRVDYSKLGLHMMTIEEWTRQGADITVVTSPHSS